MWKILKQTNHPEILRDIARCKEDYYLTYPSARAADALDFDDGDARRRDVDPPTHPDAITALG